MKRTSTFLACTAALVLAACTSDSQLPSPTGKGGVRGINAIPGSPVVTFRIEERSLGNLNYKNSSTPTLYDDFEYNFNFDIINPGEDEAQRIASTTQKVDNGVEYVFVVSGDLANPTLTTWETPLRDWSGSETVFEARFAHLAESLGNIDVYFYDQSGPLPVQGEQAKTFALLDRGFHAPCADPVLQDLFTQRKVFGRVFRCGLGGRERIEPLNGDGFGP